MIMSSLSLMVKVSPGFLNLCMVQIQSHNNIFLFKEEFASNSKRLKQEAHNFYQPTCLKMASDNQVFVGNLTFNTTEEQLREIFQFAGPVKNIRILTDKETGKPKGFAFVEYYDSNTALSAIRHLDQTELNARKLKVGFPAQGNLKDVARQIGQVVPEMASSSGGGSGAGGSNLSAASRLHIEQSVVNSLKLDEAWDLLDAMKKLVAEDNNRGNKAKSILETHPQLISAMYEIQKRLGIALPKHIQQQQTLIAAAAGAIPIVAEPSSGNASASSAAAPSAADSRNVMDSADGYRDRGYANSRDNNRGEWEREREGWDSRERSDWGGSNYSNSMPRGREPSGPVGNIRASGRNSGPYPHSSQGQGYSAHPYGNPPAQSHLASHVHSVPPPQFNRDGPANEAMGGERKSRFN